MAGKIVWGLLTALVLTACSSTRKVSNSELVLRDSLTHIQVLNKVSTLGLLTSRYTLDSLMMAGNVSVVIYDTDQPSHPVLAEVKAELKREQVKLTQDSTIQVSQADVSLKDSTTYIAGADVTIQETTRKLKPNIKAWVFVLITFVLLNIFVRDAKE